jgi:hypothetical protein
MVMLYFRPLRLRRAWQWWQRFIPLFLPLSFPMAGSL